MRIPSLGVVALAGVLLSCSAAQEQCWASWHCAGWQCAEVMGGYQGTAGPFSSSGECEQWRQTYILSSSCSCGSEPAPALTGLVVTPGTGNVAVGGTLQFTATATYSDGGGADVTAASTWSSSAQGRATVAGGVATALATGQVTITASYGGRSAAGTLVVCGAVCNGACRNTATDPGACGGCGNVCGLGASCVSGVCTCPAGQTECNGRCVSTATDAANCGGCGNACLAGQSCSSGTCRCSTGQALCDGACIGVTSDPQNCGACGNVCPAATTCSAGACACPVAGQGYCDGACVSLATTEDCGACGVACAAGAACSSGACRCPSGQTACDGACTDTATDVASCGGCGVACAAGASCVSGACTCPAGQGVCDGKCTYLSSVENCLACGQACTAGQVCSSGGCVPAPSCTPHGFGPPAAYAAGPNPRAVAIGDLDRDGWPDLALANYSGGATDTVSVFLGSGDGTLRPRVAYATPAGPAALAMGDLDGDGKLDLVVAGGGSVGFVSVLLGVGDGTFQPRLDFPVSPFPAAFVLADLDGDGILDVAVLVTDYTQTGTNAVAVLLGDGDGTFQDPVLHAVAPFPRALAAADLDGNGIVDLAVAATPAAEVDVLRGDGGGGFAAPAAFRSLQVYPWTPVAADLNGDGKLDLAVLSQDVNSARWVDVFLGHGDGTFAAAGSCYVGDNGDLGVAVTDFDGDGRPDLVLTEYLAGAVGVFVGNGDGTFQARRDFSTGARSYPQWFAVGDLNRDGMPDVAATTVDSTLTVLLGTCAQ